MLKRNISVSHAQYDLLLQKKNHLAAAEGALIAATVLNVTTYCGWDLRVSKQLEQPKEFLTYIKEYILLTSENMHGIVATSIPMPPALLACSV